MLPSKIQNILDYCDYYKNEDKLPIWYKNSLTKEDYLSKIDIVLATEEYKKFYLNVLKNFDDVQDLIKFAISHSAQQFCFWYGKQKLSHSGIIHNALLKKDYEILEKYLKNSNLPFIDRRLYYLKECIYLDLNKYDYKNVNQFIDILLNFECFNEDPFFKKGLLVIQEIRRCLDVFIENKSNCEKIFSKHYIRQLDYYNKIFNIDIIKKFPIPADYRIPQLLAYFGIFYGGYFLDKEFQKDSEIEISLRVSTINEINKISDIFDIPPYVLDAKFFLLKKLVDNNFHKCLTTYY